MAKQHILYASLIMWGLVLYLGLVTSVRGGRPILAPLMILLASPLLLAFLAVVVEGRRFGEVANLRTGAWSFMIGDTFVLTSAVALAALAWRSITREDWVVSWWWTTACALIGLGAGALFHWWDGNNYMRDGAGDRLLSPTKLAHDFVAYPVLFGALVCIGIPLLLSWSGSPGLCRHLASAGGVRWPAWLEPFGAAPRLGPHPLPGDFGHGHVEPPELQEQEYATQVPIAASDAGTGGFSYLVYF